MEITLSLEDDLVKQLRKIAVEWDTTMKALVQSYLQELAAENVTSGGKRRERDALDRTFKRFQLKIGKKTWTRADLHARS